MALIDMYDEEFNTYLNLAKSLIAQLKSKDDKEICTKWIRKLISLKTKEVSVKKNRNAFFKYLLKVLHEGVIESQEFPQYNDLYGPVLEKKDPASEFMSRWSTDKRTYIAAKPIPGKGALIYMAVAKDPSLGWDHPQRRKKKKK